MTLGERESYRETLLEKTERLLVHDLVLEFYKILAKFSHKLITRNKFLFI